MEGGDQNVGNGPGGSRWNPTKEQINMLESLYKQGLRTPSAEQIQQITVRLRDYGHIEGKNVFYWFQNHKARQRQKQKQRQENFAYFNRRFLHASPVYSPYHNVVCSPCYMPPSNTNIDPGFYQQYPKVQLPAAAAGGFKRSRLIPDQTIEQSRYNKSMHEYTRRRNHHHHQETLDLFPIHPTGLLLAKNGIIESESTENENIENKKPSSNSCSASTTPSSSENDKDCSIFGNEKAGKGHHFFDFFCRN